jgi:hypothetical protein
MLDGKIRHGLQCRVMTFDDLVGFFGTVAAGAKAIGVSRQAMYDWRDNGIPEGWQLYIQKATKRGLKADPEINRKYRDLMRWAA